MKRTSSFFPSASVKLNLSTEKKGSVELQTPVELRGTLDTLQQWPRAAECCRRSAAWSTSISNLQPQTAQNVRLVSIKLSKRKTSSSALCKDKQRSGLTHQILTLTLRKRRSRHNCFDWMRLEESLDNDASLPPGKELELVDSLSASVNVKPRLTSET